MMRVPEVLDTWFDSGSMPYAQVHYPFENKERFERGFPANFIAEGLDQTRGWFYTLLIMSTGIFDTAPFQNCVVTGMILAEDGRKMSKSLKNYPDPSHVLDEFGADALRAYLINSPVVRADPLRFSEEGVREVVRTVLFPWWNSLSFFTTYAEADAHHRSRPCRGPAGSGSAGDRPLDSLGAAEPDLARQRGDGGIPALRRDPSDCRLRRAPHQLVHPEDATALLGTSWWGGPERQTRCVRHPSRGAVDVRDRCRSCAAVHVGGDLPTSRATGWNGRRRRVFICSTTRTPTPRSSIPISRWRWRGAHRCQPGSRPAQAERSSGSSAARSRDHREPRPTRGCRDREHTETSSPRS